MDRGHVPIRTCVVCSKKGAKSDLLRMALSSAEKSIVLDRGQLLEGRGAYVCPQCLPRLGFSKRVRQAFRNRAAALALDREEAAGRTRGGTDP